MANKDHLVPKQIVNSLGHVTTVYVRPEDAAKLDSVLMSAPVSVKPNMVGEHQIPIGTHTDSEMKLDEYFKAVEGGDDAGYTGTLTDGRKFYIYPSTEDDAPNQDAWSDNNEGWYNVRLETTEMYGDEEAPGFKLVGDDFNESSEIHLRRSSVKLRDIERVADDWQRWEDEAAEGRAGSYREPKSDKDSVSQSVSPIEAIGTPRSAKPERRQPHVTKRGVTEYATNHKKGESELKWYTKEFDELEIPYSLSEENDHGDVYVKFGYEAGTAPGIDGEYSMVFTDGQLVSEIKGPRERSYMSSQGRDWDEWRERVAAAND